jgi:N-acetyl sugar amidotransferase
MNVQACSNCVLDSQSAPDIVLDDTGVCNYCNNYIQQYVLQAPSNKELQQQFEHQIYIIKKSKSGKYDCIMGLSGGVDSSYLAFKAKEWGLNPLLVHFDNGWNSELAVQNINSIIDYTGFDLFTYVIDWEEFKDLQRSYIKSGVLDWEIPTDHGFYACLFEQAHKHKIKIILTGHNHQTEAIMPKAMRWSKLDVANIKDIHHKFGSRKLKSFPLLSFYRNIYLNLILKFERINLLESISYNKDEAKELIIREMGWRDYGGKHYESIFTRFYQGHVLLKKYGFDKRAAHLSNLILSKQISRKQALEELASPAYDSYQFAEDFDFVVKKLGFTRNEFEAILEDEPVSHLEYASYEKGLYRKHEKYMKSIKPLTSLIKKFVF